jgi:DNA-binding NarL/FixJ family response regulator
VLQCLLLGKSNKEIGREMGLSEATVKAHLAAIFRALNVNNRTEAARVVEQRKLLADGR